ncbi:hypothetical protein B0T26DRAFT_719412 [Lasiosphaeria miniovina]|uniref:Extracellular membrane protein CFEM domain-containing protein n=1 Tax=Lasiosphaeria miniovina TaxID=1954250 RepID=A0AA40DUV6_9PEZI|nr:uncharacterized protein B0T26DRAFT_719412 [Lasiosphaeria miniovina]KAK0714051.1 hypothetical protein B0T26DRAFT_719412 [Lasiosphaeria miniovina]
MASFASLPAGRLFSTAILAFLSFSTLASAQVLARAQADALVTPVAELVPRATDSAIITSASTRARGGDCAASLSEFASCVISDYASDDPCMATTRSVAGFDSTCGCSQATSVFSCFTKFCTTGTDFPTYYAPVSACAAGGFGAVPAALTGAAASIVSTSKLFPTSPNSLAKQNAAPPTAVGPSEAGIWSLWVGLGLASFVAMLV